MSPKLQNILHWILIIALTVLAVEPAINGAIHDKLTGQELIDAIVGILIAAASKFVYYADTVKGLSVAVTTTDPSKPISLDNVTITPVDSTTLKSTTDLPLQVTTTATTDTLTPPSV